MLLAVFKVILSMLFFIMDTGYKHLMWICCAGAGVHVAGRHCPQTCTVREAHTYNKCKARFKVSAVGWSTPA